MLHYSRRKFIKYVAVTAAAVAGYSHLIEPRWVDVVYRSLPIRNLPARLRNKRLVQIGDLHIGSRVDSNYLIETLKLVNSLAPDILVYTGDFTDHHTDPFEEASAVFPHFVRAKLGTFGILGNHDYGRGWRYATIALRITRLAEAQGVKILRNEADFVEGLRIIGFDDLWAGRFEHEKILSSLDDSEPTLVLSHNPDTVDEPGWGSFKGWILSGHTHGGQCKAPFLPPPILPVKNPLYSAGEIAITGDRKLYINRGIGHTWQVRFNVRPEISVFNLEDA